MVGHSCRGGYPTARRLFVCGSRCPGVWRRAARACGRMQPSPSPDQTSPDQTTPARPLLIAKVDTGMTVVDNAGEEVGIVAAVEMPGTDVQPDLPTEEAAQLMDRGYFRVHAGGLVSTEYYGAGDQVGDVTTTQDDGVVTLLDGKDTLRRAGD